MGGLRFVGNVVLWLLAAVGLASVLVWGATQLGYIKPLVVISGSMQPGIKTGDLLVDVQRQTARVEVGQVASIFSDVTHNLVSHRVVGIESVGGGRWSITMKGDANDSQDGGAYVVGERVWQPAMQVGGGGYAIAAMTRPAVAIPLGFALVCLLAMSLLPSSARRARHGGGRGALSSSEVGTRSP